MRAPGRSFKDELAVYRKTIAEGPNDAHRALVLEILDRWQVHPDAEKAWNDLVEASARAANPMQPASIFIAWVIHTRLESEKLARVIREAPAVLSKLSAQADRDWKKDRLAKAVEKKTATLAFAKQANDVLGHKKRGEVRQRFIRMWLDTFDHNCNKPLHDVVRVLAEVTFDEPATLDAMKKARRRVNIRPPK